MFVDGIVPEDIKQGVLGDCYFLSALSALAMVQPRLIETLLISSKEAIDKEVTVVIFHKNGGWQQILVEHTFPCDEEEPRFWGGLQPLRASSSQEFFSSPTLQIWETHEMAYPSYII